MSESPRIQRAASDASLFYRVELLHEFEISERGIHHGRADDRRLLEWAAVETALAAEVGEPEGVRTIVFDLVAPRVDDGHEVFVVCRLGAEPGEEAMAVARAIAQTLGPELAPASIVKLADEGRPSCWYPDLEEFEAAALRSLGGGDRARGGAAE